MLKWFRDLDRILRGEATFRDALASGRIELSTRGLTVVILLLGALYGLCMGSYAVVSGKGGGWTQMAASMAKVPALFFFTLVVTFPSLYVFNALVGSRLTLHSVLRLIVAAIAVMLALLASFGTIVAFFSFTTDSYAFIVLLNVVVFAVSGVLGLGFLLQTLHRLTLAQERLEMEERRAAAPPPPLPPEALPMGEATEDMDAEMRAKAQAFWNTRRPGALEPVIPDPPGRNVRNVFRVWILLFGVVGAQMSWVLRPFIGSSPEFHLFRPKGGNFFEAVMRQLGHLFGQ
jgi:hypothetical protein